MTINDIYELSLYLAEKTDDDTGFIDSEYKKQHQKKADVIIRQAIRKYADLNNEDICEIDMLSSDEPVPLPYYALKNIIPYYVGAMLCADDKDSDKYAILIRTYDEEIKSIRFKEEQIDFDSLLCGMEG